MLADLFGVTADHCPTFTGGLCYKFRAGVHAPWAAKFLTLRDVGVMRAYLGSEGHVDRLHELHPFLTHQASLSEVTAFTGLVHQHESVVGPKNGALLGHLDGLGI